MELGSLTHGQQLRRCGFSGAACVSYLLVIVVFTLGKTHFEIPGVWRTENQTVRALKPIPLDDLLRWDLYSAAIDYLGNTALFVPFGFFVGLWLSHSCSSTPASSPASTPASFSSFSSSKVISPRQVALVGFLTSLALEVLQYLFCVGRSDIDDLLFNTLGAVLGAQLLLWVTRRRHGQR